ncbi:glycosyl hydrolase catalytic core-domain-containing protein [Dendryphion nanum]|uniref:Glycosyl hydrolase catalytic core-domain-containing protein n=1 Tax=Dendryphion nanum TaxID=256645 RepID=A0A9P9DGL3_9PLEO|nr:glycosyl hydrolase catalytic core-domain-containing protein [Dendryphion nanum]
MLPKTLLFALLALLPSPVISVFPSRSPKRGLCHVPSEDHPPDDKIWTASANALTWYYNYLATPSPAYAQNPNLHFIPMLWGQPSNSRTTSTPFLDQITSQLSAGQNITYVLGFNEPDGPHSTGGSNLSPLSASQIWQRELEPLRKLGIKLGAPAVTGSPRGFTWLKDFFAACDGKCNPDFMPIHWYGNFEGLASFIGQMMAEYPELKIWVTEWGFPWQDLKTTQGFFATAVDWLDRIENITHYAYFGAFRSDVSNVGPNSAMLTAKGQLTDIGSWYMGGNLTHAVPTAGAPSSQRYATFAGWALLVLAVGIWGVL